MARGNNRDRTWATFVIFISVLVVLLALQGRYLTEQQKPWVPEFTDPHVKLAQVSDPRFTDELLWEAVSYEPELLEPGTQVNMVFWSGPGNHGSAVRLLDSINNYAPKDGEPIQRAIWDEGPQSSLQYPAYVDMNARELWYQRASPKDGKTILYGKEYADPYNVTFAEADAIWGAYSQRYAEMAAAFKQATGKTVQVWCFVQGAKPNRVFYTYEYPELVELEHAGAVAVHFAKTPDADWRDPEDWKTGTANASPGG
ncbi:MAG: hypothetical protein ACP5NX_01100 [Candidatus Bilamarchaeaceae archaeon]